MGQEGVKVKILLSVLQGVTADSCPNDNFFVNI